VRSIRSFLNVDTPSLAKIWFSHHHAYSSRSDCTVVAWDLGVLAKPFFRSDELLVAEDPKEGIVGFIHFGRNPEARSLGKDAGILHRLCVRPGEDEDAIASELLSQGLQRMANESLKRCVGLGAFHDSIFYIGIAEGDGFLGVHSSDVRLLRWMQNQGFRPLQATECWELSLARFKLPMDRVQIAVRRNSIVSQILAVSQSNWWQNVVYGHCDLAGYHLATKSHPHLELTVNIWTPEAFVPGVESWMARWIIPEIASASAAGKQISPENSTGDLVEYWICLLSECIRLLQNERKQKVQAVIDPSCSAHVQILQRLGFATRHHGMVMSRDLSFGE
jgi:hypothetical protein